MAYNVANFGTITSGATIPVAFTFNGNNVGAQYAQGNPENPGGNLVTSRHQIFRSNSNQFTYQFQLQNFGANTSFTLAGGGLT